MKYFHKTALIFCSIFFACCGKDAPEPDPKPQTPDASGYALGADVSWLTEMEKAGRKFYDASGKETECMELLRSLGLNSIRLRVWVNPSDGWCNKEDVLVKAFRAKNLGFRIMIDFHYSDVWADPSHQTTPAAWQNMNLEELKQAVALHTKETLNLLKTNGISPEWVQAGNETGNGMLWETGKASVNMANYTALNNAGYDAVKSVFPDAKVIVHLHNGQDNSLYRWLFDGLKKNGGKWDVIGMSLYPEGESDWQQKNNSCIANIKDMISRYGSEVMICEVGMPWDKPAAAKAFLADLIAQMQNIPDDKCSGIFYWEPESYNGWKGYTLGAFDNSGKPTEALDAFTDASLRISQ
ncbi:MAG: arabinogalactan endo-1,4-beta-galactosidase [Dysgonamonadaceae bacterium]|jgi:arabinogalactan endo-1,4-beta-galactosidase|nr:arabinogalactan endo-1,4-beta-galactosidase [Dysgonamonadaceae bacterium]